MDTNSVPTSEKPKPWQNPQLRIAVLLFILISLVAFYLWKKHQLTHSDSTQTQSSTFNQYLNTLVSKLKSSPGPVATAAPIPTPSPTPTPKPLPHGLQIYRFSHGKNVVGPKPTKVMINPIDPKLNSYQTFTVTIKHNQPVTSAQIVLVTNNYSQTIPLKLKSGSLTDGVWVAKYKFTHSYNHTYQIKMLFSDGQQEFHGGLTFR